LKKGINDMKETAKLAALILCLILVTQTLACAGDTDTEMTAPETETAEEETTRSVLPTNLPDMDWQGREFRVLGYANGAYPQFSSFEIYSDGETGEVVIDAIYRRNRVIEDRYNVKIAQYLAEEETSQRHRKVAAAYEDLYDLGFFNVYSIGLAAREKLFFNLNDIDYIDFSQSYWYEEVNKALSYRNRLYFTSSDFALRDKNRAYILLYNRAMAENFGLGNLADLVRAGTWTVDKMTEFSKLVSSDLNGNESIATFCEFWANKVDYDVWYVGIRLFSSERALFYTSFPHDLKVFSADCEFEYRIIPFPKYDDAQDNYYTSADFLSMLFAIPVTNAEPDFAGFMLEALSSASTSTSLQAYYEISCKTKYTYDEESAEMLDLIFSNIVYETALVYGVGDLGSLYMLIPEQKKNTFVSLYKTREKRALKDLEKLAEDLAG